MSTIRTLTITLAAAITLTGCVESDMTRALTDGLQQGLEQAAQQSSRPVAAAPAKKSTTIPPPAFPLIINGSDLVEMASNAYRGSLIYGPTWPYQDEMNCWAALQAERDDPDVYAEVCTLANLLGTLIEAGNARNQLRQPALHYQGDIALARVQQQLREAGFSQAKEDHYVELLSRQLLPAVFALTAAGM